ncbi:MAG: hypothetical protein ACOC3G_04460 [Phycisphaeraceae bacterium]
MPSTYRLYLHDEYDPARVLTEPGEDNPSCLLAAPEGLHHRQSDVFTLAPPALAPEDREDQEQRNDAPEGASIFAIGRRGELKWCTPSAQRDLKQIGARHPRRAGRLTPEWAFLLWKPIHPHRLEYQIAPLDADSLPCRGRVAWSPRRPLELTVSIWRLRASSDEPDPTWRRLMRELRGEQSGDSDDRPAA